MLTRVAGFVVIWRLFMTTSVVNERLAALLDYVGQAAGRAESFAAEQGPLIAREIVAWSFWSGMVVFVACVAMTAAGVALWRHGRSLPKPEHGPREGMVCLCMLACILWVAAFLFGTNSVIQMGKSIVAPRVVVLEYVRGALR